MVSNNVEYNVSDNIETLVQQPEGVLFFLLFPLCRGEAGLLVTATYGYFRD